MRCFSRRWAFAGVFLVAVMLPAIPTATAVGGISAGRGGRGLGGSAPVQGGRGGPTGSSAPYVGSPSDTPPALPAAAVVRGTVRRAHGTPAGGVGVRFERRSDGRVAAVETGRTGSDGTYAIKLADGTWEGMACDSTLGYQPTLWRITVADGQILRFREIVRAAPSITKAEISLSSDKGVVRTGDEVTLTGAGFRCSGHVVVEVDGMEPVTQRTFEPHEDTRVSFAFPPLRPATDGQVIVRRVRFTYVQGPNRSNTVEFRAPLAAADAVSPPTIGPPGNGGGGPAVPGMPGKRRPGTDFRFRR